MLLENVISLQVPIILLVLIQCFINQLLLLMQARARLDSRLHGAAHGRYVVKGIKRSSQGVALAMAHRHGEGISWRSMSRHLQWLVGPFSSLNPLSHVSSQLVELIHL